MMISDYTMPVQVARDRGIFETEDQIKEYDRQRRLRNKSPNAKCLAVECEQYNRCRGYCDEIKGYVSRLRACPINHWIRSKAR